MCDIKFLGDSQRSWKEVIPGQVRYPTLLRASSYSFNICNNGETKDESEHHYIFINCFHSCMLFRSNSSWDWALYSSANAADVDSKSRSQYGLTQRCLWEDNRLFIRSASKGPARSRLVIKALISGLFLNWEREFLHESINYVTVIETTLWT